MSKKFLIPAISILILIVILVFAYYFPVQRKETIGPPSVKSIPFIIEGPITKIGQNFIELDNEKARISDITKSSSATTTEEADFYLPADSGTQSIHPSRWIVYFLDFNPNVVIVYYNEIERSENLVPGQFSLKDISVGEWVRLWVESKNIDFQAQEVRIGPTDNFNSLIVRRNAK